MFELRNRLLNMSPGSLVDSCLYGLANILEDNRGEGKGEIYKQALFASENTICMNNYI